MGKVTLAHQIISFESLGDVSMVDTNRNTQQHVLWAFCNFSIQAQQIRALECLETEVVVVVISAVIDVVVEHLGVGHDDVIDFF